MHQIDAENAEAYLRAAGRIGPEEAVSVRRLLGGVSNEVLYVERAGGDFVLKQARPQLRVADPWFCSIERIWREVETLRICGAIVGPACRAGPSSPTPSESAAKRRSHSADGTYGADGTYPVAFAVPQLLFEDRDNYAFAMTAAPPHEVWKQRLLAGQVEPPLAAACGRLLAALHAGTWHDGETASRLHDRSFFDDLRIDPYYRRVAEVHPDVKPSIARLIDSLAAHPLCLVHGDFSPKNLLVSDATANGGRKPTDDAGFNADIISGLTPTARPMVASQCIALVDFEVGHYGDPAFDLGFFLTHLVLKAYWSGPRFEEYFALTDVFWRAYREGMTRVASREDMAALEARAVHNFAACMLARLDGKSKVEYLTDETLRKTIRRRARELLLDPALSWEHVSGSKVLK